MIRNTLKKYYLIAAVIGCFFVYSCENKLEDVQNVGAKHIGVEVGKDIESYLSQDGKTKAKLTAPLMLRYQKDTPKVEFPKSLFVNFYNDSLKVESKLSAKYGQYLENENKIYLRDSVVIFNVKGDTLLCRDLYWDQQKGIFYTDKNVIIKKPGNQIMHGKGMVAQQDFKRYTIKQVYNSVINIPDSSFVAE
jgi:LPS export ABC transporter protein LptC